jgi:eukaryotic-like serine/threonine-protein kinase
VGSLIKHMQRRFEHSGAVLCLALGLAAASQSQESGVRPVTAGLRSPVKLSNLDAVVLGELEDRPGGDRNRAIREALRAALDESPYLNLVPDAAVEAVVRGNPGQISVSGTAQQLTRVCQTTQAKAYVTGLVKRAVQNAAVEGELSAADCASGATLAHEQFTADRQGLVDALGRAAEQMRLDLGEPLDSVQRFRTPLSHATSESLEALDAWSSGLRVWRKDGPVAALPLLESAVKNDPAFSAATYDLGLAYRNSGQEERARELFTRAFGMRDRASTRKRWAIAAQYYAFVTVDQNRAVGSFRAWIGNYPRDYKAVSNLGSFYGDVCRYGEAIAQFEQARRMNPNDVVAHEDLMEMLIAVGNFHKARTVYQDIVRMHLDDDSPHLYSYVMATLENDAREMAAQSDWFEGRKDLLHEILSEEADAAAYAGHLARARELTERAVLSGQEAGNAEQAAAWLLNSAWREELFGNEQLAHDQAIRALTIAPGSREGEATAAIIFARAGDVPRAESLVADLAKRYANHSVMQSYWLPTIRAQVALRKADLVTALKELRTAAPLDLLYPQVFFYSHMASVVLRAEAYMLSGQSARAVEQWQAIMRNPGIVQLSATVPYARLQLGRSHALSERSSERSRAREAYEEFFRLWTEADADIPLLKQARAEFGQLH